MRRCRVAPRRVAQAFIGTVREASRARRVLHDYANETYKDANTELKLFEWYEKSLFEPKDVQERTKRYDLPPSYEKPETVDLSETMSGIRKVEEDFPVQGLWPKLRRQSWYPYRGWILGSLYLILLFILFSIWR